MTPSPKPNGHSTESHKPVLIGQREAVKVKEPFKAPDYAAFWKAERERLAKGEKA